MYISPTLQHGKIRVLSQWAKAQVTLTGFYLLGGGDGELAPKRLSFPLPKSFPEKNLKLFQIKILSDNDFKESVKVTNVQKCDFSQF